LPVFLSESVCLLKPCLAICINFCFSILPALHGLTRNNLLSSSVSSTRGGGTNLAAQSFLCPNSGSQAPNRPLVLFGQLAPEADVEAATLYLNFKTKLSNSKTRTRAIYTASSVALREQDASTVGTSIRPESRCIQKGA
jgi:hypothetical protein